MAELDYDDFHDEPGAGASGAMQRLVNWSGAAMSIALVAGLAVWGYRLAVRDVTGVPVVRALEGPMRVAPEDPGGSQAENQGLAVNRVAAEGEAAAPAERLLLAPRPAGLTREDLPRSALPQAPRQAAAAPPRPSPETKAAALAATPDAPVPALSGTEAGAPGAAAQRPAAAPAVAAGADAGHKDDAAAESGEDVAASVPALDRSRRPVARPASSPQAVDAAALAAIASASAAVASARTEELDVAALTPGTNLVQLGAFDSVEMARAEWQRLSARFQSFMAGKNRVVQPAVSGGRTFYRLRAAGFADISDARRFCAALTAENADCIPVVSR